MKKYSEKFPTTDKLTETLTKIYEKGKERYESNEFEEYLPVLEMANKVVFALSKDEGKDIIFVMKLNIRSK